MARSSAAVEGRLSATAFRTWSLKMRKAGTPRRLASLSRQWRRACSTRDSEAPSGWLRGDRFRLARRRGHLFLPAFSWFGDGQGGVLHEEIAGHDFFQSFAIRRQARLAVGNLFAVLLKDCVGEADEVGAGHGAQDLFKVVAGDLPVREGLAVQFAGGPRAAGTQGGDDGERRGALRIGGGAEALSDTFGGSAEIANAAGFA